MNTTRFLLQAWTFNPLALAACAAAAVLYWAAFRSAARWGWFTAAVALLLLTLMSPLNALADGVLFSAHMTQHILLLLIVPALLWFSLPRTFTLRLPPALAGTLPLAGWAAGVGSMWFWHVPQFCDAAATSASVHAMQTISLLALGTLFWGPILAPQSQDRLMPGLGVAYLFTACLACTGLGIILTLTSFDVCPIFRSPARAAGAWAAIRESVSVDRDRQIGGLLMWVPMCLVYVAAIMLELIRWLGGRAEPSLGHREVRP